MTLTSPENITLKTGGAGRIAIDVGLDANIGQGSNDLSTGQFTATGNGNVEFIGTVNEGASYGLFSIDIGGDALIDNYDFNAYPNLYGASVIAGGVIEAEGFTHFYGNAQGINTDNAQPYTFQAGGNIDLSNLVAIGIPQNVADGNANDTDPRASNVSITSTSGDIDLSSLTSILTTADGITTIDAGTGDANTHELSTHDGSSLTIGGNHIMVEDLVSSTGDLTLSGDLVLENGTTTAASPLLATWNTLTVESDTLVELPVHDDANAGAMTLTLAQTVSTNSITIAEVSAPAMTSLTLTDQSTAFDLVANDFGNSAVAAYTINITGNAALDAMSFTNVDNVSGLTTAGNVDTFVVNGMDGLTSITAGHTNGTNAVGTKLHIIDNTSLTSYTSATSKMHEIIITGNTAMTALDLSSYLDTPTTASLAATASDLFGEDFVLNVVGNGITGTYTPKDNSGTPNTALDSAELSEVKLIATHLLGFTQANSVTAVADFLVGGAALSQNALAGDQYNGDTDFTDGINTLEEFALLND